MVPETRPLARQSLSLLIQLVRSLNQAIWTQLEDPRRSRNRRTTAFTVCSILDGLSTDAVQNANEVYAVRIVSAIDCLPACKLKSSFP